MATISLNRENNAGILRTLLLRFLNYFFEEEVTILSAIFNLLITFDLFYFWNNQRQIEWRALMSFALAKIKCLASEKMS